MEFNIQDKVKLKNPLSYLKTSDNMPMLRPPDLVAIDEVGEIIAIKSPDTVEIKFRRGSFLIDIISPTSSIATKSGGLSMGMLSEVLR